MGGGGGRLVLDAGARRESQDLKSYSQRIHVFKRRTLATSSPLMTLPLASFRIFFDASCLGADGGAFLPKFTFIAIQDSRGLGAFGGIGEGGKT